MATGKTRSLDIVSVPDFSGAKAWPFEVRSLFFIAALCENAANMENCQSFLACIGQPPDSVQWLAERAGATLSIHEPLVFLKRRNTNKLRGLEAEGNASKILLLDLDVFLLGDLSPLAQMQDCLSAAPATTARIPARLWRTIYAALGMELPTERIQSLSSELSWPMRKEAYPGQMEEMSGMVPYYNSGVLLAPRRSGLRQVWEDHIRTTAGTALSFEDPFRGYAAFKGGDQAGLATSISLLRQRGIPFVPLPDRSHVRKMHLLSRKVTFSQARVFHAIGFLKGFSEETSIYDGGPRAYSDDLLGAAMRLSGLPRQLRRLRLLGLHMGLWLDYRRIKRFLRRLYHRHVVPALKKAGRTDRL